MHNCSLEAKIKMNLGKYLMILALCTTSVSILIKLELIVYMFSFFKEAQIVEKPSEVKKAHKRYFFDA